MFQNPFTRRFNPADYKGAPEWFIGRFLSSLNLFTEPVFQLLQNGISLFANCNTQEYDFTITAGATPGVNTVRFTKTMSGAPRGMIKLACNLASDPTVAVTAAVDFSWYVNGETVFITAISGLTSGSTYAIRVLIF